VYIIACRVRYYLLPVALSSGCVRGMRCTRCPSLFVPPLVSPARPLLFTQPLALYPVERLILIRLFIHVYSIFLRWMGARAACDHVDIGACPSRALSIRRIDTAALPISLVPLPQVEFSPCLTGRQGHLQMKVCIFAATSNNLHSSL
jgi:hypothetical protein